MSLIDRVYDSAIDSLRRCCTPSGLMASGQRKGHHQIWARDSMIALLGGVLTDDKIIHKALQDSIRALRDTRAPDGCIPNNVNPDTGKPNFRAYADGGLWWIIGSSLRNANIGEPDLAAMDQAFRWYACQDVDQSGLISMQEAADWQDLFCTRGKGLYLNCVYVIALRAGAAAYEANGRLEDAVSLRALAHTVTDKINLYFWYNGDGNMLPSVAHTFSTDTPQEQDSLGRRRWLPEKTLLIDERYYLPYLAFRTPGEWFDTLAHSIAILAGVADETRAALTLDFIEDSEIATQPAASLFPCVEPGDPDWRPYYGMLNTPYHYHNGGVWPFIGGFYVAALVHAGRQEQAAAALERLAALNQEGGFNEWHHGSTGEPMGVQDQAWSAGMYLYAWHCVRAGKALLIAR